MQGVRTTIITTPQELKELQDNPNISVGPTKEATVIKVDGCEIDQRFKEGSTFENVPWTEPGYFIRSDNSQYVRYGESQDIKGQDIPENIELIPLPPQRLAEYYGWSQGIEFYVIESEDHFDLFTRDVLGYNDRNAFCSYEDTDPLPYHRSEFQTIVEYMEYAEKTGWEDIVDNWMEDIHGRVSFHINEWAQWVESGEGLKNKYIIEWR